MVTPQRAVVRPRIISPVSGEILPLDEVVAAELDSGCRIIQISGGPGSGKTTALAHLAATLPPVGDLAFLDDAATAEVASHASRQRVICTTRLRYPDIAPVIVPLSLAPWTDDELIEYLRAAAPDRCASVMRRISASSLKDDVQGNAGLWRSLLDQFVGDESLASIRVGIQRLLASALSDYRRRRFAADFCLAVLLRDDAEITRTLGYLMRGPADFEQLRLLRHPLVQRILAGERIAKLILSDGECPALAHALPRPLVEELAGLAARDSVLAKRLHAIYASDRHSFHPQVATILFALDPLWRPNANRHAWLAGASFVEANWHGIVLPVTDDGISDLSSANLTRANLQNAILDGVLARDVRLTESRLDKASLVGMDAMDGNLTRARLVAARADRIKLSRANLTGAVLDDATLTNAVLASADLVTASFRKADLAFAVLVGAMIEGTDFTGANLHGCVLCDLPLREAVLDGASFLGADLSQCDLEGVRLAAADFEQANLNGAWLTGSVLPGANFHQADLRNTGLADIQWEGADLREADLRGCTFHMGSTRSGLVGSPYPGHGSKTGFYTDDFHDQDFKQPEGIRKANLCDADLRGAQLDGVDFYLVDLRGALLDDDALKQVERTGGILRDRCT